MPSSRLLLYSILSPRSNAVGKGSLTVVTSCINISDIPVHFFLSVTNAELSQGRLDGWTSASHLSPDQYGRRWNARKSSSKENRREVIISKMNLTVKNRTGELIWSGKSIRKMSGERIRVKILINTRKDKNTLEICELNPASLVAFFSLMF